MHIARRRVFCSSLGDVFDNQVSEQWRADLFGLISKTPNIDWLLLTKRIGNVRGMMPLEWLGSDLHGPHGSVIHAAGWPANVWAGATICNREEMLRDGPKLKTIQCWHGARTFWSVEPMLGDLGEIPRELMPDWIICGGESGPHARPMHPDWARSLLDQCQAASVPFFFKQWGEWVSVDHGPDDDSYDGKSCAWLNVDGKCYDPENGIDIDLGLRKQTPLKRIVSEQL